jgi:hypothetical protein
MSKRFANGAEKRKLKKEREESRNKLPKVTEYFSRIDSNVQRHDEHSLSDIENTDCGHCGNEISSEISESNMCTTDGNGNCTMSANNNNTGIWYFLMKILIRIIVYSVLRLQYIPRLLTC